MRNLTVLQTSDGVIHATQKAALSHLDKKLAEVLSPLAHQLVKTDAKYGRICDWLDSPETLEAFRKALEIHEDMKLVPSETSED